MRIKEAYQHLLKSIHTLYESREARSITDWVIEDLTGMTRSGILIHHDEELKEEQEKKLQQKKEITPIWIVLKNNKPYLVVGTPGGTTIPTSVFQTIVNVIDSFDTLNEKINHNIREKFLKEYTYEKLALYWYNIFKNLSGVKIDGV